MSANSLTSVSLDPPLLLVCPAKSSETWPAIREGGKFCVNVMASHHEPTVRRFAVRGVDRFEGSSYHDRSSGPALDDAIAWIDCELLHEHDAGDHTIAVCAVIGLENAAEGEPLVFFRGRYGTFASTCRSPRRTCGRACPRASCGRAAAAVPCAVRRVCS